MRTRIKICGITRVEHALLAAELGVDAIGLVFYANSPRNLEIEQARQIALATPPFVTTVALFMDAEQQTVQDVLQSVPVHCLQFHGQESEQFCNSFNRAYIKSVPMMGIDDVGAYTAAFPSATGFLLDAVQTGEAGGQGRVFDWRSMPPASQQPFVLAGGLNPENVVAAIQATGCTAVDVSSGVEVSKGVKSAEKMREFVQQVNSIQ